MRIPSASKLPHYWLLMQLREIDISSQHESCSTSPDQQRLEACAERLRKGFISRTGSVTGSL